MSKAVKDKPKLIASREEAEQVLGEYGRVYAENEVAKNKLALALQEARDEFEPGITTATKSLEGIETRLEMWAENNGDAFGDKRSLDMLHGTIGFRKGQRTLKTRASFTWEKVLLRLEPFRDGLYVRLTPSVDKEAILRDELAGALPTADLVTMGVRVAQDDNFYVDPKLA